MIVDYVNHIPLWVNSDNKRYVIDGLNWTYDANNFSNAQFVGLDNLIITRKATIGENLYIRIKNEYNISINQSLKVNFSYWYTTNVEAVANGTYVYTFKLDMWATYCIDLLYQKRELPLLHRRSHLHTTNSKFAEDELFSSVQKTVVGYKNFGRGINPKSYSFPNEKLQLQYDGTNDNFSFTNNDIYYVFRDKASGGYRCFPLINGWYKFRTPTINSGANYETIISFLPKMWIYDKNGDMVSHYSGSGDPGNGVYGMNQFISNTLPWYRYSGDATYKTDNVASEWYTYFNRNSFAKANSSFFIRGDVDTTLKWRVNELHNVGSEYKLPLRDYGDIYVNIYQEEEFDYINFYYFETLIYQRQVPHIATLSWRDYKNYTYILFYAQSITSWVPYNYFNNTGTKLNALINDIDNINDFVGIYRWIPVNMLNDDNLVSYRVKSVDYLCYMLDKNGTYPSGQQFLDGGYMDMFIDRARDPRLNVSNYVMSWNSRVMMETKWFDNIIDPRLHFGTYGNNNEKTSIGIFGFFWFNENGFKWTKTSDYGRVENTSLHMGGALVSSTSEYKQYISSQLSTLETGYNLQKSQTKLDKSRNNFNSVFNGLSSMVNIGTSSLLGLGQLLSYDVGGSLKSFNSATNSTFDFYRNIGNTIYNNKQANLDLKKVKDTTIATVSDRFRASTNQMEQSSTKDMTLAATIQRPNGIWFIQEKLHKQTIMGYNNINVMYGFVNNEYLKLLDTIYKSDTETKLSWIELDEEDVRVKLSQYFNQNIPYQFHEEMFKILTTGFRLWSGSYENYGNWIYDN